MDKTRSQSMVTKNIEPGHGWALGWEPAYSRGFSGSGSVMGRLYIGAVLAVYLEQGVVVEGSYKEQLP